MTKRNATAAILRGLSLLLAVTVLMSGCRRLERSVRKWKGRIEDAFTPTPPPRPPGNRHSVTINWSPSTSKVVGYNVYRSGAPGSLATKLTPQPVKETQFT